MGLRRSLSGGQTLAMGWLAAVVVTAVLAPWLSPWAPDRQDLAEITVAPGVSGHWLGTDDLGRDVFSRLLWASRAALLVGFITVGISALGGTALGLLAGLARRWADETIMLLMDGVLAVPTILLALAVATFLGTGLVPVTLALGIVFAPVFARLARAKTRALRSETFVEASRALGTPWSRIVVLRILPNIAGPLVVQAALTFALAIVIESSLSYLGLGTQPPDASWGLMLKEGRSYLVQAPWLSLAPGAAITLTVLSCNVVGEGLAEILNPRNHEV